MSDLEASWRVENIGRALSFASAVFERDVLFTVRQGEFAWVTPVQLALFRNLDLDGTPLTELAARARITKQSMQELVDKAERFGVVVRRPDPHDRRVKIVAFTQAGLLMLERFRPAWPRPNGAWPRRLVIGSCKTLRPVCKPMWRRTKSAAFSRAPSGRVRLGPFLFPGAPSPNRASRLCAGNAPNLPGPEAPFHRRR